MDKKLAVGIALSVIFTGLTVHAVSSHAELKAWRKTGQEVQTIVDGLKVDLEFYDIASRFED